MQAMDVARICASGRGPRKAIDRWMLVVVAHAGSYDNALAPRAISRSLAAELGGFNPKTAWSSLDRLVKGGWLTSQKQHGQTAVYSISPAPLTCPENGAGPVPKTGHPKNGTPGQTTCTESGTATCPENGTGVVPKTGQDLSQKRDTYQSSSEFFREDSSSRDDESRVVPPYLSGSPPELVDLVFLLNRKGKHRVMNHGFELEMIVRLGNEDLDIPTPAERAKWLLAGYRELLAAGYKAPPVEYICDRAQGLFVKARKAAAAPSPKVGRRRIDCETDLSVWAQTKKDLER